MRSLLIILFLSLSTCIFSQDDGIIGLVFSDKSNFSLATVLGHKAPAKYYLLSKTDQWNGYRFKLKEDVKNAEVRKRLENDEHHPYNHSYLFRDSSLDKLFAGNEKEYLFAAAKKIKERKLAQNGKSFSLIPSFSKARTGFFFSTTDPVLSSDKQFAFIDVNVFYKDSESKELSDTYYARICLIYQKIDGKFWVRFKKINALFF
jgi:hypothetical protein